MDRYPAFGQLPASVDPLSEYALARVIDRQDDQNVVLVAEAGGQMVHAAALAFGASRYDSDLVPADIGAMRM
jgi:hypothetical protein